MAKQLQALPPHGRQKYPWDKWQNGKPWKATRGRDYRCPTSSFQRVLATRARRDGLHVTTRVDGNSVVFQFSKA